MKKFFIILLICSESFATNFKVVEKQVGDVKLPFVRNADVILNEHGEENSYSSKADFSEVERLAPLDARLLNAIQPANLRQLTMEEFNQLYARLGSGPMPYGDYSGFVLQKPPTYGAIKKRILKQIQGASAFMAVAKQVCQREAEDCLFEFIWKGKRFYPKNALDQVEARTAVNFLSAGFKFTDLIPGFLKPKAVEDALDFAEGVIDKNSLTLFPMNTYCGISQLDTRRESIIIDAAFSDDFASYIPLRDEVITRKNLNITEEFRMLRPGLYIGKVYSNKLLLFNLVLEKSGALTVKDSANACFDGTKTR